MDLSGNNFRSVSESTDFSFNVNFGLEGQTGIGELALSGESKKIKFDFESGKIYDNDDRYIYSYSDGDVINISGDASPNAYSYYLDGKPFSFGKPKDNFKLQKVCFDTTGMAFSNTSTEIKGTKPDYYVEFPSTFTHSGYHTGHIVNNSSSLGFRVLGVDVVNAFQTFWNVSSFDSDILPNNSGKIVVQDLSGYPVFDTGRYDIKIHSNFGPISTGVQALSSPADFRNVSFSVSENSSGILDTGVAFGFGTGETKTNSYIIDYSAYSGITASGDKKLYISLEYEKGTTGDFFNGPNGSVLATGDPIVTVNREELSSPLRRGFEVSRTTGIFSGVADVIGSGYEGFSKRQLLKAEGHTGNFISGYANSSAEVFVYASGINEGDLMSGTKVLSPYGDSNETFIGTGSGILTEYYDNNWNYTPGAYVATTGEITGIFTGKDIDASKLGNKHYSAYITGNIATITSGSSSSFDWGAFLNPNTVKAVDSNYASSGITGTTDHSGLWDGDIIASGDTFYSGSGDLTGYLSGYSKSFTGSFDLMTGVSGEFSFRDSGISVYTGYKTSDDYTIEGSGESAESLFVKYTTTFDYEPLVALLTVSGIDGNIYTESITGIR
tara:strand:- start:1111 stop:2940 length:1830 start_codon:yes stop_codon:yes gene_type:complete